MSTIKGVVQAITTRDVAGGKKAFNIMVAGQEYGAGLYAPKCKEGDYVMFELDDSRGYKNVGRNSLKVSANKPPAEAIEEAVATTVKSSTGSLVDNKQDVISRQSAANTAVEFIKVLSANDALGLPKDNAKGKKQELLEQILAKYTQEFYENNTGVKFKSISPSAKETEVEEPAGDDDAPADEAWQ